jgi:hypothetical protein
MNTYTTDENGTYIVDRSGKKYRCNVAHPLPLPEGWSPCGYDEAMLVSVVYGPGKDGQWSSVQFGMATHWLARAPLPEVPRPKTQAELDREAYMKFIATKVPDTAWGCWQAACEYARKEQP